MILTVRRLTIMADPMLLHRWTYPDEHNQDRGAPDRSVQEVFIGEKEVKIDRVEVDSNALPWSNRLIGFVKRKLDIWGAG